MKKLKLLLVILSVSLFAKGQIELEHTFNSYVSYFNSNTHGVMYYYSQVDTLTNQFNIYKKDYTLYKTITVNRPVGYSASIYLCSEKLFNLDNSIEFILFTRKTLSSGNYDIKLVCYNENGNIIKDFGTFANDCYNVTYNIVHFENYNKLVLNEWILDGYNTKIYSLPGSIPTKINTKNNTFNEVSQSYPNPTNSFINLTYSLDKNETATINIFDMSGRLIEQKQIGGDFDKILLDVSNYQKGLYIYEYKGIKNKFIVN